MRPQKRVQRVGCERDYAESGGNLFREQLTGKETTVYLPSVMHLSRNNWLAFVNCREGFRQLAFLFGFILNNVGSRDCALKGVIKGCWLCGTKSSVPNLGDAREDSIRGNVFVKYIYDVTKPSMSCWLGNQDSNLDLWIQNPLSYH